MEAYWWQSNYPLTSDRSERFKRSKEFKPTGGKITLRPQSIEAGGSLEVWYGGDGPCREATPCFGTQPHCLQVQLARHCLLANEPSASVAPSEVWCRRRDSNPHGFPHTPLKRACLPVPPLRRLGACRRIPSLRGEGDADRCKAAGAKKPEAYSLEYVEDFFEPRTKQMTSDHSPQ